MELPQLSRRLRPGAKAPVRIVHLGLGAFHRSHQAWYTHQASDAADWGIAAFTGRRPDAALALAEQDGLYTVVNGPTAATPSTVVSSIVEAVDGADVAAAGGAGRRAGHRGDHPDHHRSGLPARRRRAA